MRWLEFCLPFEASDEGRFRERGRRLSEYICESNSKGSWSD